MIGVCRAASPLFQCQRQAKSFNLLHRHKYCVCSLNRIYFDGKRKPVKGAEYEIIAETHKILINHFVSSDAYCVCDVRTSIIIFGNRSHDGPHAISTGLSIHPLRNPCIACGAVCAVLSASATNCRYIVTFAFCIRMRVCAPRIFNDRMTSDR